MVIGSLSHGGAERVCTTLADNWAERGWDVTVITLASEQDDFYRLHPNVQRVALDLANASGGLLSGVRNNIFRVRALRDVLTQTRPEITLGLMPTANVLTALAVIGTGLTAVGSEHVHPPKRTLGRAWKFLQQVMYPRLAFVSALTQESADWLKSHTRTRNIPVIPNPVAYPLSTQPPHKDPASLAASLGGERWLLAVGRLVEQKGFDRLLAAYGKLAPDYPDWRLVIVGEGALRQSLERQVSESGLEERVALPGAVGNIDAWYQAADVYAMTSRYEGFGNTLAEALAYGLACVAVDCETGPRDILRHEVDGLLVADNDMQGLEQALRRLMADEDLRNQFATRAVEARQRFSVAHIAGRWEELFAEALS